MAEYVAQKFVQVAGIHAEAYSSAEFRHGPLSMLDEVEKTAVMFFALDDEIVPDDWTVPIESLKTQGVFINFIFQ